MNPNWIRSICEDSTGAIWVGTDGGISRLDRELGKFTHFVENRKRPGSLSSNAVTAILKDPSGTMWIGSWGGLDRFNQEDQRFKNFSTESIVTSICEDHAGTLWIGTNNCLLLFDSKTGRFTRFVHDPANSYSLSSNEIQTVYEDRTGTLWIGTQNGINRLDRQQYRFKQIVHNPNDANSLSHKSAVAIHEGHTGALWIATSEGTGRDADNGLNKLDRETGRFYHSFPGLEREDIRDGFGISYIYQDHMGILWIGTWFGLGRYDPEQNQFERFVHDPDDPHSLSGNFVWRIYEDRAGTLWIGINKDGPIGVDRFDRVQKRFSRIEFLAEVSYGLDQWNGVHSISQGQSGRIWFATMGDGIFLLNPDGDEFIQFTYEPGNPDGR